MPKINKLFSKEKNNSPETKPHIPTLDMGLLTQQFGSPLILISSEKTGSSHDSKKPVPCFNVASDRSRKSKRSNEFEAAIKSSTTRRFTADPPMDKLLGSKRSSGHSISKSQHLQTSSQQSNTDSSYSSEEEDDSGEESKFISVHSSMGLNNQWDQHEASPDDKSKYKICEGLTYKTAPGHYDDFLMSKE